MPKTVVFFYLAAALWLLGFAAAAVTAGASSIAVVCGTLGLLAFLTATAARIGAQQPPAGHRAGSVRGGG